MMKKYLIALFVLCFSISAIASSSVKEGVVEKAEVITGEIGKDGKPVLGAVAGAATGSLFGSGSGNTAAKVVGGLIGARSQKSTKTTVYGWRYIVKVGEELEVVDAWCEQAGDKCTGLAKGNEVYIINGNEVSLK